MKKNVEPKPEFNAGRDKKYKVKAIQDSVIYISKAGSQLLEF